MSTHPFRTAGAGATVVVLVLAVLIGSHGGMSVTQTQRVHPEPLVTEYQLGDIRFTGFTTIATATDIEVHFHESGRTVDQLLGGANKSNCNDQRCPPPSAASFRIEMFGPNGKSLGNAWGDVLSASYGSSDGPELPEFDFDMTWPRGEAGRYRLVIGYAGLGEFERDVDVK